MWKALLIGVPHYDSDVIPDLEFVPADLERLKGSLGTRGYQVETLGGDDGRVPTRGTILRAVRDFCVASRVDDTLVLSFSGHGIHVGGRDFLVPSDGEVAEEGVEDLLVPVDFSRALQACSASAVLFFIDACREGLDLGTLGAVAFQRWGEGKLNAVARQQFAYVFSCGPGQVSRFVRGEDSFSLFSRALADALGPESAASTFGDLRRSVQERMNKLTEQHSKKAQTLRVRSETGVDDGSLNSVRLATAKARSGLPSWSGQAGLDLDAISGLVVGEKDLVALSRDLDGREPLIEEEEVSLLHILRAAHALRSTARSVVETLRRFEPAGLRLPEIDLQAIERIGIGDEHLKMLDAAEHRWDGGVRLEGVALLRIAHELGEDVAAMVRRLGELGGLGLAVDAPDPDGLEGLTVTADDMVLLSRDLDGVAPWIGYGLSVVHPVRASNRMKLPLGTVLERLRKLSRAGGFEVPDVDPGALAGSVVADELVQLIEFAEGWGQEVSFTAPGLLLAAHALGGSVGQVAEQLEALVPLGVTVPKIPSEARDLRVDESDLTLLSVDFDAGPPWVDQTIPPIHLLLAAHVVGQSTEWVVRRLRVFESLGLVLPEVDMDAARELHPDDADAVALGELSREEERFRRRHVLRVAASLGETVGEVLRRLRRYEAVGIDVASFPAEADPVRVDADDLAALEMASGDPGDLRFDGIDLARAAQRLGVTVGEVLERLARLEAAGVRMARAIPDEARELMVAEEDLVALSVDLDGVDPWLRDAVPPGHLVRAARLADEPVGAVIERLERFEPLGIRLPRMDRERVSQLHVDEDDVILVSQDLDGRPPWLEKQISPMHALRFAHLRGESVGAVLRRIERVAGVGLRPPPIDTARAEDLMISDQDVLLLSSDLSGAGSWVDPEVPASHVLRASQALDETVGAVLERIRRLAPAGFSVVR